MKYLIVQDWRSTHGNHAGMKHMCDMLVEKYPAEYGMYVKEMPKVWEYPKTFLGKIQWKLFGARAQKAYIENTYPKEYLELCKPLFSKLKAGDEVFLLEYLLPWTSQYELACYIRKNYPEVKIYALSHLTCKIFDEMTAKEPGIIKKWAEPVDKMLTLGSSLSAYFEKAGISKSKISTGFHYVDSTYYYKQQSTEVHSPMRIIMMGALQRDYGMLAEIVRQCPNYHWTICCGRKKVDNLFPKSSNVELKGFLSEEELRHQMDIADISLNVMEDTVGSNVITTSMAMGLAIVVSDVGSIRDYCDDQNAVFCRNDVASFKDALDGIASSLSILKIKKGKSKEKAENFNIEKINNWFCRL